MVWIVFVIAIILINKLPDWKADRKYNNTDTSNVNIGKMLEDKYNGVPTWQIKNNASNGKYDRKK